MVAPYSAGQNPLVPVDVWVFISKLITGWIAAVWGSRGWWYFPATVINLCKLGGNPDQDGHVTPIIREFVVADIEMIQSLGECQLWLGA